MRPERSADLVERDFLTRAEVAAIFQVSPHTVTRWGKEGKLPSVMTPGGQRRYPRRAVERLVGALQHGVQSTDDWSQQ